MDEQADNNFFAGSPGGDYITAVDCSSIRDPGQLIQWAERIPGVIIWKQYI